MSSLKPCQNTLITTHVFKLGLKKGCDFGPHELLRGPQDPEAVSQDAHAVPRDTGRPSPSRKDSVGLLPLSCGRRADQETEPLSSRGLETPGTPGLRGPAEPAHRTGPTKQVDLELPVVVRRLGGDLLRPDLADALLDLDERASEPRSEAPWKAVRLLSLGVTHCIKGKSCCPWGPRLWVPFLQGASQSFLQPPSPR